MHRATLVWVRRRMFSPYQICVRPYSTVQPLYEVFCDGASRGNPGMAGAGVVVVDSVTQHVELEFHQFLGDCVTNNVAEYSSVVLALEEVARIGYRRVRLNSDSQLLVNQSENPNSSPVVESLLATLPPAGA
jgi:hypothetical protein